MRHSNSTKRKLKILMKDVQRNNYSYAPFFRFFEEIGITFWKNPSYSKGMPVYRGFSVCDYLLKVLSPARWNRFWRLCRRLGRAAKKQDKEVHIIDILECVFNNTDARKILFLNKAKTYVVKINAVFEKTVVVRNGEETAKYEVLSNLPMFLLSHYDKISKNIVVEEKD